LQWTCKKYNQGGALECGQIQVERPIHIQPQMARPGSSPVVLKSTWSLWSRNMRRHCKWGDVRGQTWRCGPCLRIPQLADRRAISISAGFAEGRMYERGWISRTRAGAKLQRPQPQPRGFRGNSPGSSELRGVGVVHRRPDGRSSLGARRESRRQARGLRFGPGLALQDASLKKNPRFCFFISAQVLRPSAGGLVIVQYAPVDTRQTETKNEASQRGNTAVFETPKCRRDNTTAYETPRCWLGTCHEMSGAVKKKIASRKRGSQPHAGMLSLLPPGTCASGSETNIPSSGAQQYDISAVFFGRAYLEGWAAYFTH
jgi:hypothetical protein